MDRRLANAELVSDPRAAGARAHLCALALDERDWNPAAPRSRDDLTGTMPCNLGPARARTRGDEGPVGPAVCLASDDSRYVTGRLFHVDGDWTAAGRFPDSYVEAAASRRKGGR